MRVFTSKHATTSLEGSLKITFGRLVENVDRDGLRVVESLETHKSLDEERLGIVHVEVEENHHGEAHVNATNLDATRFRIVVR